MTEDTRDHTADWHAQFAPAPADASGVETVTTERLGTVEHFADADGVFVPPVPAAEPAPAPHADQPDQLDGAPADDAPKGKGKKGDTETAA